MKNNLKKVLCERKMTMYQLSCKTGIAKNTLTNIAENRTKGIQYDVLERICRSLNVTPNELLELDNGDLVLYDQLVQLVLDDGEFYSTLVSKIAKCCPNFFDGLDESGKKDKVKETFIKLAPNQSFAKEKISQLLFNSCEE